MKRSESVRFAKGRLKAKRLVICIIGVKNSIFLKILKQKYANSAEKHSFSPKHWRQLIGRTDEKTGGR